MAAVIQPLGSYLHGIWHPIYTVTIPEALETFAGARIFGSVGSESVAPGLAASTLKNTKSKKTDIVGCWVWEVRERSGHVTGARIR